MIRMLAQIVSRQVRTPVEGIRDEPDPPVGCPNVEQTPSISRVGKSAKVSSPGAETWDADRWPEEHTLALVVLFTQLAQRRVQAARAEGGDP